jgi:hypothetical protein
MVEMRGITIESLLIYYIACDGVLVAFEDFMMKKTGKLGSISEDLGLGGVRWYGNDTHDGFLTTSFTLARLTLRGIFLRQNQ